MSTSPAASTRPRIASVLPLALSAGIVAAATSALEIYVTSVMPVRGSFADFFSSIASIACGPTAPPFDPVAFGVLAHIAISVGWAYGYADLASRNVALVRRPWVSGMVYGLLVFLGMQSILLSVHQFHSFTPLAFLNSVILHTLFFGVPVALVVARLRNANA